MAKLEILVRKKMKVKITRDEGWFSESDLKALGWSSLDA